MAGLSPTFTTGFSIGTDISISITQNQNGQLIVLEGRITSTEEGADDVLIKTEPIDNGGLPDYQVLPNGWTGTLEWDRQNDVFSAYIAALELARYQGGPQISHTVTSTKRIVGGTGTNRTSLLGTVFHQYKPGTWTKTAAVKGRVSMAAQQRIQLS